MEQEIFSAGVRPGAPTTGDEIKILICYILSETNAVMSFAQIHEALREQELVNYFELVAAMYSLEQTGHIKATEENSAKTGYAVTDLGKSVAGTIDGLLPVSVRDKAVGSADRLLRREKREQAVHAEIVKSGSGFNVRLELPDADMNLIELVVFCPTREEAELVRKRFLNDPIFIYKGVLALLTGDKGVIGEIFPSKENLF